MKLHVFALYDKRADDYGRPMYFPNGAVAMRDMADEVNNPQGGVLHNHPEDFALMELGWFETESCTFDLVAPRLVFELSTLVEKKGSVKGELNGVQLPLAGVN